MEESNVLNKEIVNDCNCSNDSYYRSKRNLHTAVTSIQQRYPSYKSERCTQKGCTVTGCLMHLLHEYGLQISYTFTQAGLFNSSADTLHFVAHLKHIDGDSQTSRASLQAKGPINFKTGNDALEELKPMLLHGLLGLPYKPEPDDLPIASYISEDQYDQLVHELRGHEDIKKDLCKTHDISSLLELPKDKFFQVMSKIREIKRLKGSVA